MDSIDAKTRDEQTKSIQWILQNPDLFLDRLFENVVYTDDNINELKEDFKINLSDSSNNMNDVEKIITTVINFSCTLPCKIINKMNSNNISKLI